MGHGSGPLAVSLYVRLDFQSFCSSLPNRTRFVFFSLFFEFSAVRVPTAGDFYERLTSTLCVEPFLGTLSLMCVPSASPVSFQRVENGPG